MMTSLVAAGGFSGNPLWYTARSTGVVSFLLLTATLVLGIAATQRALAGPGWPRFATQVLHRNLTLVALVILAAHVITTILDTYVSISWWSVIVPFTSSYRPLPVAAGTVAFDLILVITATSLLRPRIAASWWRWIHWTSYAAWPLALLHFIVTGTDGAAGRWGFWLGIACLAVVLASVAARWTRPNGPEVPLASVFGHQR